MRIEGSVALVTGANGGLGATFWRTLLDGGALGRTATLYGQTVSSPTRRSPT